MFTWQLRWLRQPLYWPSEIVRDQQMSTSEGWELVKCTVRDQLCKVLDQKRERKYTRIGELIRITVYWTGPDECGYKTVPCVALWPRKRWWIVISRTLPVETQPATIFTDTRGYGVAGVLIVVVVLQMWEIKICYLRRANDQVKNQKIDRYNLVANVMCCNSWNSPRWMMRITHREGSRWTIVAEVTTFFEKIKWS